MGVGALFFLRTSESSPAGGGAPPCSPPKPHLVVIDSNGSLNRKILFFFCVALHPPNQTSSTQQSVRLLYGISSANLALRAAILRLPCSSSPALASRRSAFFFFTLDHSASSQPHSRSVAGISARYSSLCV